MSDDDLRARALEIAERSRERSAHDEVQEHLDAVAEIQVRTERLVAVRRARLEGYAAGWRDGRRRRWWR